MSLPTSGSRLLIAALGSKLLVLSKEGKVVSEWTSQVQNNQAAEQQVEDNRPVKKPRLSSDDNHGFIHKLTAVPQCKAVAIVTEDKALIVLNVDDNGTLSESSRRPMPKRPSAIQIIAASETILCADKFGDVYSLPLFPKMEDDLTFAQKNAEEQIAEKPAFKPSATTLTVHSKRNRMALESQQKQTHFTPRKAPLAFVHHLLLGHVSMLTDMIHAQSGTAARSQCIITADRDEHIRVSRCPPQAHIIEGYCLGHEEFVSKLCTIQNTTLLVSGGGDDWLGLWDWPTFQLKHKIMLRQPLQDAGTLKPEDKLSVSQLWELADSLNNNDTATIVAGCEGIAVLVIVTIDVTGSASPNITILPTQGIPLAMTSWSGGFIFSFDVREASGTRLQHYTLQIQDAKARLVSSTDIATDQLNAMTEVEADPAIIDGQLHNTATLRKRRGWDEPEEEQD